MTLVRREHIEEPAVTGRGPDRLVSELIRELSCAGRRGFGADGQDVEVMTNSVGCVVASQGPFFAGIFGKRRFKDHLCLPHPLIILIMRPY